MRIYLGSDPFSEPLNELLASAEGYDDRGLIIAFAAYIDDALLALLKLRLVDCSATSELFGGGGAAVETFSSRIKLARATGCISETEYQDLNIVRKLRNNAAHGWASFALSNQKERDQISNLSATKFPDMPERGPRDRLRNRLVDLLLWFEVMRREAGKIAPDGQTILPRITEPNHWFGIFAMEPGKD